MFIAVGRKYLRSEVPALFWWLGLLDKEGPQVRVTSDIVLLADSCKEDTDTSDAYSQLQAGPSVSFLKKKIWWNKLYLLEYFVINIECILRIQIIISKA